MKTVTCAVSFVILAASVGCANGPEQPPTVGHTSNPSTLPTPDFNGGFEARTFGYTGSCSCSGLTISCTPAQAAPITCGCRTTTTGSDVACAPPFEPSNGWTVTPSYFFAPTPTDPRLHPAAKGNGGVFFQYGAGRNPGPPRPPGYQVPDGTALYFQTCNIANDPTWCEGDAVVTSSRFAISGGAMYRLGAWLKSTTFMVTGEPRENRTRFAVRFFDASGAELGSDGFNFEPNAAPVADWTNAFQDFGAPSAAAQAQVEIHVDRYRQSNVYVDDVSFSPL